MNVGELIAELSKLDPNLPVVVNDYEESDYMTTDTVEIAPLRSRKLRRWASDEAIRHYDAAEAERSMQQTYRPAKPEDWGPEWKAVVIS